MKTIEIKIYGESIGVYNAMENIEDTETWTEIKEKVLGAVHRIELAIETKKDIICLSCDVLTKKDIVGVEHEPRRI